MKRFIFFLFLTPLSLHAQVIDESLGTISDHCDITGAKKHVWIFKQWHLSPGVNTHTSTPSNPPQKENQTAIYQQLESWVDNKKMETVFSEGCTGEITDSFSQSFNGWNIKDLSEQTKEKSYDEIVTLIPLKLKAKYHSKIKVYCADDEKIIQKQNEYLSDARGTLGFLTRIEQLKDDPTRLKPFLEKAIEIDHLPPRSTADKVIKRLFSDLKEEVGKVKKGIDDRNLVFFKALKNGPEESALVVGGLHAQGLVKLLKENKIDCTVVEPKGYRSEDEKIFSVVESGRK